MEGSDKRERDEVFSRIVKAGKRTYFLDVKKTRKEDDFYLTITESKKKFLNDGEFRFEKHKIFLYKEDFDKFRDAIGETMEFIEEAIRGQIEMNQSEFEDESLNEEIGVGITSDLTDVNFDDLGK